MSVHHGSQWVVYSFNKKAAKAVCDENDSAALSLGVEFFSSAK